MVCDRKHEKESKVDMKVKIVHRVFSLCCVVAFVLLLTGCNPTAGATRYEIIYPSGYAMDYCNLDKKIPVEGTAYYLKNETRCYFYEPGKEESDPIV